MNKFFGKNFKKLKQKILIRRKQVWNMILIIYIALYINTTSSNALPQSTVTSSHNLINPENRIEIIFQGWENLTSVSTESKKIEDNSSKFQVARIVDSKDIKKYNEIHYCKFPNKTKTWNELIQEGKHENNSIEQKHQITDVDLRLMQENLRKLKEKEKEWLKHKNKIKGRVMTISRCNIREDYKDARKIVQNDFKRLIESKPFTSQNDSEFWTSDGQGLIIGPSSIFLIRFSKSSGKVINYVITIK